MKFKRALQTLFLWIALVLPLWSFATVQPGELFKKANAYYAKARYAEALDVYEKIISGGQHSPAVYFNMGNASYKLGDLPSALLYYEKAHELAPNDEEINANIRLANSKTRDKIEEVPEFFMSRWWTSVYLSYSADTLAVISLLLSFFGSFFLIIYFFALRISIKKPAFFISLFCFAAGLSSIFILSRQVSYFEQQHGIVFNSPVYVKSAPAEDSRSLFLIHEGLKVSILEVGQHWVKVRLPNGNEGWIKSADLREI
ncbi:MAG: tetratricopeptide repeat protein [Pedobacter sp.]|uniref:tetratricopeptide repeat protein n=1 Tax=Pedobacter sp. TaxID=1411316 RepID=UPI00339ABBBA